eukprot:GHVH01012671.1.p1 GENE.GHVH01012671.1~~GHVH01012671.1.p1  ORF type:complete len:997 (+),score=99.29 GHVH01012671.1:565-3555(+)
MGDQTTLLSDPRLSNGGGPAGSDSGDDCSKKVDESVAVKTATLKCLSVPLGQVRTLTSRFSSALGRDNSSSYDVVVHRHRQDFAALPAFTSLCEEKFEDYFDSLASLQKRNVLPVGVMRQYFVTTSGLSEQDQAVFMAKPDFDEAIDSLALELFKSTVYSQRLETEVFIMTRQESVQRAVDKCQGLVRRLTRLSVRRGRGVIVAYHEEACRELLLRALPPTVADELGVRFPANGMEFYVLAGTARDIEQARERRSGRGVLECFSYADSVSQAREVRVYHAEEGRQSEHEHGRFGLTRPSKRPREDHRNGLAGPKIPKRDGLSGPKIPRRDRFRSDGEKDYAQGGGRGAPRCYNCGALDHIARACPGRGGTCSYCGNIGHKVAECRTKTHMQQASLEGGSPERVEGDVRKVNGTVNHDEIHAAALLTALRLAADPDFEEVHYTSGINRDGLRVEVTSGCGSVEGLVDTGASVSVFRADDVRLLGLEKTDRTVAVRGIGSLRAVYLKPSCLSICGVSMIVSGVQVADPNVPTLIGRPELERTNAFIDLTRMIFVNAIDRGCSQQLARQSDSVSKRVGLPFPDTSCDAASSDVDLLVLADGLSKGDAVRRDVFTVSSDSLATVDTNAPVVSEEESSCEEESLCPWERVRQIVSVPLCPPKTDEQTRDTVSGVSLEEKEKVLRQKLEHLSPTLQEKYYGLFNEFGDVWREPRSGQMLTEASFTVKGPPVVARQRERSAEMELEFEKQIKDMLAKGVIRHSKSDWGTVPVFVQKKEGTWRMALDYRRLNKQLVFDAYPIPRPWDMVKALVGQEFYTALDANWGFWNLRVAEDSKKYTAIITPWGLYEFNVLPFGIKNSPGEFQRAMDAALRGCRDFVHCYIDDMSFGANDETTHFERLRRTLEACRLGGVYLKIEKAHILQRKVCILGHIVSKEGIQPDPKKITTIKKLKSPTSVKEVRSFVGAVQFLARFVNLAHDLAPLIDLTKKHTRFGIREDASDPI